MRRAAQLAPLLLLVARAAWGEEAPPPDAGAPPPVEPAPAWSDDDDWLFDEGLDPAERDDIECSNRGVFAFNEGFYEWVADPINSGFEWLVPEPGRRALHRFFDNLDEPAVFVNEVLQLAPLDATKTLSRFTINSTIGLLGFFDPATALGVPVIDTDFGETLAVYAMPSGSYVVIPLLGPSTARDTFGELVDAALHPSFWFASPVQQVLIRGSGGISEYDVERERLDALRATSVDFYAAIRGAYLMDRDAKIDERREGRWWVGKEEEATEPAELGPDLGAEPPIP